jgi:hypothetical protein
MALPQEFPRLVGQRSQPGNGTFSLAIHPSNIDSGIDSGQD